MYFEKVAPDVSPAEGDKDLLSYGPIASPSIGTDDALDIVAEDVAGYLSGARWVNNKGTDLISDDDPQPPAMTVLAVLLVE